MSKFLKLFLFVLTCFSVSTQASPAFNDGVSSLITLVGLNPTKVNALARQSNAVEIQFFDSSGDQVPCQFNLNIVNKNGSLSVLGDLLEKSNKGFPKRTQRVFFQGTGMISSLKKDGAADQDLMEKQLGSPKVNFSRLYFRDDTEDVTGRVTIRTEVSSTTSRRIQILSLANDPKGLTSPWCSLDKVELFVNGVKQSNIESLR